MTSAPETVFKAPVPTIQPPISMQTCKRTLYLTCPFSTDLRDAIVTLKGRWERDEKVWRLPHIVEDKVVQLMKTQFGWVPDDPDPELIPVQITALRNLTTRNGPLSFAGVQLAVARSRDSRARPGPGVSLVDGEIDSGGSTKYWTSNAVTGTVWRCHATKGQIGILLDRDELTTEIFPDYDDPQFIAAQIVEISCYRRR